MNAYACLPCKHNKHIGCDGIQDCQTCGWDPEVLEARRQDVRRRLEGVDLAAKPCRGNEGLCCNGEGCDRCEWNPAVAERRKQEIRRGMEVIACLGSSGG